jgi:rhodanese-related sulfurtransferase
MAYDFDDEQLPYTTIGTDEAHQLIEAGARVIDVRTPQEWQQGHIAEATLVPIGGIYAFGKALQEQHIAPDEEVIFVCASGQRSAAASEIGSLLGLRKVHNLANGMHGWANRSYPITR